MSDDEGYPTPARAERARVVKKVLRVLQNPLALMTVPEREEAYRLALDYKISAKELLDAARGKAQDT
jgi:hypothetical protein